MTTNNANDMTNPISVNTGGTGDASFTAYAVVCGGTTTTAPLQSVSGVGTSGQVLTSNDAGMLPTFQSPAVGTVVFLHTTVAVAASDARITTGFSATYKNYLLMWDSLAVGTDTDNVYVEVSTNGGGTWQNSGYSANTWYYNGGGEAEQDSTASIILGLTQSSTGVGAGHFYLYNVGTATTSHCDGSNVSPNTFISNTSHIMTGRFPSSISINAIRFRASSGTISGNFSLYGIIT